MLRRKFTVLENMLLLTVTVLFLTSFYYLFLLKPVLGELGGNRLEISLLQKELEVQLELASQKNRMQERLENPPRKLSGELLPYDNAKNEMRELERVLGDTLSYDISADMPIKVNGIVRRNVRIDYGTDSYDKAVSIIKAIEEGPYRCLISDVEMMIKGEPDNVETSLWMTYFELNPEEEGADAFWESWHEKDE